MKYLVVIFTFCLVAVFPGISQTQKGNLKTYKTACINESGVDKAVINNLKRRLPVQFDDKLNCFAACMLKKIGIMRKDGTIDEAVSRAKAPANLPKTTVDQVINICKSQVGKSDCETGGKVLACLLKTRGVAVL